MSTSYNHRASPEYLKSVPKIMYFLLRASFTELDWFMSHLDGNNILKVVDWVESTKFKYAIMIDLDCTGVLGEAAMMPFNWYGTHRPSVIEGVTAWKVYAEDRKI